MIKRKIPLLLLLLLLTAQMHAGESYVSSQKKPVVAVVLAGGGALGFAHVGALKVLEEEGIKPDMVIGTSIGSIVGGLYSCGYSPVEMEQIINDTDWKNILLDNFDRDELSYKQKDRERRYSLSVGLDTENRVDETGLSQGQHVVELLDDLMAPFASEMDFNELPIPFRAVAVDLISGEKVVYGEGDLTTAIRASMSVPGIFTPVYYDGRFVIDGGWSENLPSTVAKEMGADIIIAVTLYSLEEDIEKLANLAAIAYQADQIKTYEKDKVSLEVVDLLISPDLSGYSMMDFEKGTPLMVLGYEAADGMRSEIRDLSKIISSTAAGSRADAGSSADAGGSADAGSSADAESNQNITEYKSGIINYPLRNIVVDSEGRHDLEEKTALELKEALSGISDIRVIQNTVYALFDSGEYTRVRYRLVALENEKYDLFVEAPPVLKSDELISGALDFSMFGSRGLYTDLTMKLAYQYWFGDKKTGYFDAEAWLSKFPSLMFSLGYDPLNWNGMLTLRTGVIQQLSQFYETDRFESSYIVRTGGQVFFINSLFSDDLNLPWVVL